MEDGFEVRPNRRIPQGRKRLSAERVQYDKLVSQGYGFREAAIIVGVNYRTTKRWRSGLWSNTKRDPETGGRKTVVRTFRGPVSTRYLSNDDRVRIADLRLAGWSVRRIAAEMGRSPSTVSRELRRNGHPRSGDYRPHAAQVRAEDRRARPKQGKIAANAELRAYIQGKLDRKWSPEQIATALRREFPDRPEMHVVHETIYLALYVQGRGELRRELHKALRTGRARRRSHKHAQRRQPRFRDPMVMISDRPAEVEDRAVPGHWEGDLIIGASNGSAIGTLVERTTRFLMLVHLPVDHRAETMSVALEQTMKTLPAHLRKTLTWDQGVEMGKHKRFAMATDMDVYFCNPASPWQRGSNENTNGLLRQYFPKVSTPSASPTTPMHRSVPVRAMADRLGWSWDSCGVDIDLASGFTLGL